MCKHSQTLGSRPPSSEYGRGQVPTSLARVIESAVANSVTATPRPTKPSVKSDTTRSHGP